MSETGYGRYRPIDICFICSYLGYSVLYESISTICSHDCMNGLDMFEQVIDSLVLFNSFPDKPLFLPVSNTSLVKTLREKKKLLITSNFSFSLSVFHPFGELSSIFIKFEIVVCKLFQFGRV